MKSFKRKTWYKKFVYVFIFVLSLNLTGISGYSETEFGLTEKEPAFKFYPKISSENVNSVIFLIGDGMGIAQITAARINFYGADGRLNMEKMPVTGFMNTHAVNKLVTDSAASATAMATGYKTYNGRISMTPEGKKALTILEACMRRGKSTGLIATSRITHATPACFGTHVIHRNIESEIAIQLVESKINIILGGGRDYFIPSSFRGGKRWDKRNLIEEATQKGYTFVGNREEFFAADNDYILGLFQLEALTTRDPEPTLAEMTEKEIKILSRNKNGFFLMVEGSQIDWECHDNDTNGFLRQMKLFDEAVKVGLSYALKDKKTLVIVTGDHETGGLAITSGDLKGKFLKVDWISTHHTGVPLPVFAFGPFAERFTGLHDNTDIPVIIAGILKIKNFPALLE